MKVTETQITQLKEFTQKHFVEWVDLQMELVDHLANGIESQWETEPNLSFDQCLEIEFNKFGVFGFMDVVDSRRQALEKKYSKLIFHHFKEFFSFPRILVTISSIFMLFLVFKKNILGSETKHTFVVIFSLIFLSIMIYNFLKSKNKEKKWLYEDILLGKSKFFTIMYFPIQTLNVLADFENDYANVILAFTTVSFSMIIYVMHFKIPSKVDIYLNENYPEYRFYSTS